MGKQADEDWSAWETASVEECRRQGSRTAAADAEDAELPGFLDAALADLDEAAEGLPVEPKVPNAETRAAMEEARSLAKARRARLVGAR